MDWHNTQASEDIIEGHSTVCWALVAALFCLSPVAIAGPSAEERSLGSARWGADYFPNVTLITQEGKRVRFFDDLIKGKVVVINFIYTSCPDSCPLETARLAEVAGILGNRLGQDIFFYSISIDPARDTPKVLKEYAKRYQARPGWLFLTGDEADIKLVRKKLGLYMEGIQKAGSYDHSLDIVLGNQATGVWIKRSPFENPYMLASQIGDWLHNWKLPPPTGRSFADAPKLRNITKGEELFRTRCASCHVIGTGDGGVVRLGPDLLGVTERRDRAWLKRWLEKPDVMVAEKDPIAIGLLEAFNHVPMPNFRLNDREASALIQYLDTESRRVAKVVGMDAAAPLRDGNTPKACCKKRENLIMESKQSPTPAAQAIATAAGDVPASRARWGRLSPVSLISLGMGLALGIVTVGYAWRSKKG